MADVNHPALTPLSINRIADLAPWFFWAREDSLGLDAGTIAALNAGNPTEEQLSIMRSLGMAAKNHLIGAIPGEAYVDRRPS